MSDFGYLAAPARRALANAGISNLSEVAWLTEAKLMALHGMGPNAMRKLKDELARNGLRLADG